MKQQLNQQICLHLVLNNTWYYTWQYMLRTIERKLQEEAHNKYQNPDKKIQKTNPDANDTSTTETRILPEGYKLHRHTIFQHT